MTQLHTMCTELAQKSTNQYSESTHQQEEVYDTHVQHISDYLSILLYIWPKCKEDAPKPEYVTRHTHTHTSHNVNAYVGVYMFFCQGHSK